MKYWCSRCRRPGTAPVAHDALVVAALRRLLGHPGLGHLADRWVQAETTQ